MTDDRRHINWDMIVRHLMDVATDEEREEVERWLAEDEGNREYYRKAKRYFETYYTGKKLVWWIARERGMNLSFMQINLGKHIFGERLLNMRQFCCFLYAWDSVTGFWK